MNLFRGWANPSPPADTTETSSTSVSTELAQTEGEQPPVFGRDLGINSKPISLSAEERNILEEAVAPKVRRILPEISTDKAAAEFALGSQTIIHFPNEAASEKQVAQDDHALQQVVAKSVSEPDSAQLLDGL